MFRLLTLQLVFIMKRAIIFVCFLILSADRLAQLVECRTRLREVSGSSPRPDQHSGS